MPKRKSQKVKMEAKNEPPNQKSLNQNEPKIEKVPTVDKELSELTGQIDKNQENDLFIEAPLQYLLLNKLANNSELNEIINENLEGDKIDGFKV